MKTKGAVQFLILPMLIISGCNTDDLQLDIREDVAERLAKFSPVEISADISFLPENEHKALSKLIQASKYMDKIFLRQAWAENPAYKRALTKRSP